MSQVFRDIQGHPIAWQDSHGTIHACEGTEVRPGIFLYWTLCEIDVPESARLVAVDLVTCPTCRERMLQPGPSVVPEAGEAEAEAPGPEEFVSLLIRKPGR